MVKPICIEEKEEGEEEDEEEKERNKMMYRFQQVDAEIFPEALQEVCTNVYPVNSFRLCL